jgi:hypothetical protein
VRRAEAAHGQLRSQLRSPLCSPPRFTCFLRLARAQGRHRTKSIYHAETRASSDVPHAENVSVQRKCCLEYEENENLNGIDPDVSTKNGKGT